MGAGEAERRGSGAPGSWNGSWEREGRNPATAAVVGLLLIGAFYFYGQSLIFLLMYAASLLAGSAQGDVPAVNGALERFVRAYANPIRISLFLSQYLCMLLPTLWLVRRWHSADAGVYLRYRKASVATVGFSVIGTIALFPISSAIATLLSRQFPMPRIFEEVAESIFTAKTPAEFAWLVLVIAVTPAICEETLFRGYAQRTLERVIGWKSIFVIGIIFGLFHMQPIGLISLSLIGIFIGYLLYRTGSIYPSMAAHFTNNFLAVYLVYRRPTVAGIDLASPDPLPVVWLLAAALLFLLSVAGLHVVTRHRDGALPISAPPTAERTMEEKNDPDRVVPPNS